LFSYLRLHRVWSTARRIVVVDRVVVGVSGWGWAVPLGLCVIAVACGGGDEGHAQFAPHGSSKMDAGDARDSSAGSSGKMDGEADHAGHSDSGSSRSDAGANSDAGPRSDAGPSRDAGSSTTFDPRCSGIEPADDLQQPVKLATDIHVGFGMSAIAVHGSDVFFITDESVIMRTTATGAVAKEIITRSVPTRGLKVEGDYLYWLAGDYDSGRLERMPIAGGDVESFGRARSFAGIENVIAFDDDNVYWTDFDLDDATIGGRIMRMPKKGGTAEPVIEGRPGIPFSIATDGTEVFWSENASLEAPSPTSIMAMPLQGGNVRLVGNTIAGAGDIAVDAIAVYFGSSEDGSSAGVFRMNKAGGNPIPISSDGFVPALHLVIDEAQIYWGDGRMMKATKDGCEVTTLVEIVSGACMGITMDGTHVYYTNPSNGADTGLVLRLSK
jgi:hypothetical protein